MQKMRVTWVPGSMGTRTSKDVEVASIETGDGVVAFMNANNVPVLIIPATRLFDGVLVEDAEDES